MPVTTRSQSRARVVASLKSTTVTTKRGQSRNPKTANTKATSTTRPGRSHERATVKTKPKEALQPSDRREARAQATSEIQKASRRRLTDKRRAEFPKVQTASKKSTKETGSYKTAKGSKTGVARKVSQKKPANVRIESDGPGDSQSPIGGFILIREGVHEGKSVELYRIDVCYLHEIPKESTTSGYFTMKLLPQTCHKVPDIQKAKENVLRELERFRNKSYHPGNYNIIPEEWPSFIAAYDNAVNDCI